MWRWVLTKIDKSHNFVAPLELKSQVTLTLPASGKNRERSERMQSSTLEDVRDGDLWGGI